MNSWTRSNTESGDDNNHFIFINTALNSADRVVIDIADASHPNYLSCFLSGQNGAFFQIFRGSKGSDTLFGEAAKYCWNIFDHLDEWNAVEFMFDRANNKFAQWINGTQVVGTGGNGVDQSLSGVTHFDNLIISGYRSSYPAYDFAFYIDDVVVADVYIGPTDGDPTAPVVTANDASKSIVLDSYAAAGSATDAVWGTGSVCKWRIGSPPDDANGGTCTGTTSWTCSTSGYASGLQTLYVSCRDGAGNWGSDTVPVTYTPPDTTAPNVVATDTTKAISADSYAATGTSSDAVGVTGCKWSLAGVPSAILGTACTNTGTAWSTFSCATSGYTSGLQTLHLGCGDLAGNWGSDSVAVTYTPLSPPHVSTIAIGTNGLSWTFTYDKTVTCSSTPNCCDDFVAAMTIAGPVSLSYSSGSGTASVVCTGNTIVYSGDTVANGGVDYNTVVDGIQDSSGTDLESFIDKAVSNGSTQTVPPGGTEMLIGCDLIGATL